MTIRTRELQERLIALAYDLGPAKADGVFGRRTRAAVAQFLADQQLDIRWPGTVGPKPIAAINEELVIASAVGSPQMH